MITPNRFAQPEVNDSFCGFSERSSLQDEMEAVASTSGNAAAVTTMPTPQSRARQLDTFMLGVHSSGDGKEIYLNVPLT